MAADEMIRVVCPNCSKAHRTSMDTIGQVGICSRCGLRFRLEPTKARKSGDGPHVQTVAGGPRRMVCPHCWVDFAQEDTMYVAQHDDLVGVGDPVLGPDAMMRFRPTRFSPKGHALDPKGVESAEMACPRCHLRIPSIVADLEQKFVSVIGAVASGKTYFLTTALWQLRRQLAQCFNISLMDADALSNAHLRNCEDTLFAPADPSRPVALDKTQLQSAVYRTVHLNGQDVSLPTPFYFEIDLLRDHHNFEHRNSFHSVMVLYDNAGEHFQPGFDTSRAPGTRHMANSEAIMFVFDPLQDPGFAKSLRECKDPQVKHQSGRRFYRQDVIITEAAQRIRRMTGASPHDKLRQPLYVLVSKWDAWRELIPDLAWDEPLAVNDSGATCYDTDKVKTASWKIRAIFEEFCPVVLSNIDAISDDVRFIPISALGRSPFMRQDGKGLVVRPEHIQPRWVTVPWLDILARWKYIPVTSGADGR